jgi:hypothetical protein
MLVEFEQIPKAQTGDSAAFARLVGAHRPRTSDLNEHELLTADAATANRVSSEQEERKDNKAS